MTTPHLSNHQDAGRDQATNDPFHQPIRVTATLLPPLQGNAQAVSHGRHPASLFQQDSIGTGVWLDPTVPQHLHAPLLANDSQFVPEETFLAAQAPFLHYPCQAPSYPVFGTCNSDEPYDIPLQSHPGEPTAGLPPQSHPAFPATCLPVQAHPVPPAASSPFNTLQSTEVNYGSHGNHQVHLANAYQPSFFYQRNITLTQPFMSNLTAPSEPTLGSFVAFDALSETSWGVTEQSSDSASPDPLPLLGNAVPELPIQSSNGPVAANNLSPRLDMLDAWDPNMTVPVAPVDIQAFLPAISQHPTDQPPSLQLDPCIDSRQFDTGRIQEAESEQMERARVHRKAIKRGPVQNGVAKRRRFPDEKTKEETRLTRMRKACIRCHLYRVRCFPDVDDPNKPCVTCQLASPNRLPCIRYKVTDISLFRLGPSEDFVWSRRWLGKGLKEIATWQSKEAKWVTLTQGYGNASITVQVKRFVPLPSDILSYKWKSPNGENKSLECAPYALADVQGVQGASYELKRHIKESVIQHVSALTEGRGRIIGRTFTMILSLINQSQFQPKHTELLQDTLHLWVASRLIEKPWKVAGNETLEHNISDASHPFWDDTSPYYHHVPVTPVMDNQLDQVVIKSILLPLARLVMKRLRALIEANKPANWFVIYLCTFILLNNYEVATGHDRNFALRYSLRTRFSNYRLLEGFHAGAKTLLAHFHYCCKGHALFQLDWSRRREIEPIKSSSLNDDQREYLRELRATIATKSTLSPPCHPKPSHVISQN